MTHVPSSSSRKRGSRNSAYHSLDSRFRGNDGSVFYPDLLRSYNPCFQRIDYYNIIKFFLECCTASLASDAFNRYTDLALGYRVLGFDGNRGSGPNFLS